MEDTFVPQNLERQKINTKAASSQLLPYKFKMFDYSPNRALMCGFSGVMYIFRDFYSGKSWIQLVNKLLTYVMRWGDNLKKRCFENPAGMSYYETAG